MFFFQSEQLSLEIIRQYYPRMFQMIPALPVLILCTQYYRSTVSLSKSGCH